MGLFRREDNNQVIELDFEKTMEQDRLGYVTLDDGVKARRCVHLELQREGKLRPKEGNASSVAPPIISDSLGVCEHQFAEFEADRVKHGFHGVEFVREPGVPEFFQAHFSSFAEKERYRKHRDEFTGLYKDRNSRNGSAGALGKKNFQRVQELVQERYGKNPSIITVDEAPSAVQTQAR
jgi:hypothetical protein